MTRLLDVSLRLLASFSVAYALCLLWLCATGLPVNDDAGFYLRVAEKISQGVPPYSELQLGYTPVAVFLFSLLFRLSQEKETLVLAAFSLQAVAMIAVAVVFDRFLGTTRLSRSWRVLFASQLVVAMVWLEGGYIVLEPLTVLFMLLAVWFGFRERSNWFLAGLFGGLAFLTKQYGLSCFLPLAYLWLGLPKELRPRSAVHAVLGVALSAVLVCLPLMLLGDYVLGPWALTPRHGRYLVSDKTPIEFALNRDFVVVVLLAVVAFWVVRKGVSSQDRSSQLTWVLALALVGSGVSLLIRQFPHYYILPLPFFGVLLAMLVDSERSRTVRRGAVLLGFLYASYRAFFFVPVCLSPVRDEQILRGQEIVRTLGDRRCAMIFDFRELIFLAGLEPPRGLAGYSFAENFSRDTLLELLPHQDAVIVRRGVDPPLPLESSRFERRLQDASIELWTNSRNPSTLDRR